MRSTRRQWSRAQLADKKVRNSDFYGRDSSSVISTSTAGRFFFFSEQRLSTVRVLKLTGTTARRVNEPGASKTRARPKRGACAVRTGRRRWWWWWRWTRLTVLLNIKDFFLTLKYNYLTFITSTFSTSLPPTSPPPPSHLPPITPIFSSPLVFRWLIQF